MMDKDEARSLLIPLGNDQLYLAYSYEERNYLTFLPIRRYIFRTIFVASDLYLLSKMSVTKEWWNTPLYPLINTAGP